MLAIVAATLLVVACDDERVSNASPGEGKLDAEGGDRNNDSGARGGVAANASEDGGTTSLGDGGSTASANAGADSSGGARQEAGAGAGGASGGSGGEDSNDDEADDSAAVAYRNDVGHSGRLPYPIEPSLTRRWSKSFGKAVSYPLIVGPRVFVSTLGSEYKPVVLAFDRESGAQLWSSESLATPDGVKAHLAYDRGQIFAADDHGYIMAVNAETGSITWNVRLEPIYAFATMPVAASGMVFLTGATTDSDGRLFALDEGDGTVRYRAVALSGGHVTLGASRLFTSGSCNETQAIEAPTGKELWHYKEDCSGTSIVHTLFDQGRLFVNSGAATVALDAVSGEPVARIEGMTTPVTVDANVALFALRRQRGGEVRAFDLAGGSEAWSIRLDDTPVLPLLLTGNYVYVTTRNALGETRLQAIDLREREVVWTSAELAAPSDTSFVPSGTEPLQGVAAAQGSIAVALERTLSVFAASP
jgi:outer membrane protein assembly factor BamB